jgi:SSS family solute:Na+ symporter
MEIQLSIFIPVLIIFLAIVAYTSYQGHRKTKTSEDYMIAGRSVGGLVAGLSYGATFISTAAIVGFGGIAGLFGLSIYWGILGNVAIAGFVAFIILGTKVRLVGKRLEAVSFADLLAKRYESKLIQVIVGAIIYIFIPAYTSIVLIGGARFMEGALNTSFNSSLIILSLIVLAYVIYGGLIGVMYTNAFLATVMLFCAVYLLGVVYAVLGGVSPAHQVLSSLSHLVPDNLAAAGHTGWASMPVLGSPYWWIVVSTIVLGITIGSLAQPQLVIKFMAVRKKSQLYLALAVGSVFILFLSGGAEIVGALSNVYFVNKTGKIAIAVAGGNPDLIIPSIISFTMPEWFVYTFMLGLLAAAMSTAGALLHLQGVSLARDVYAPLSTKDVNLKLFSQIGTLIGLAMALVLGFLLPPGVIARSTVFWFGLCAITWLPTYIGGLFWKGATRAGALASVLVGFGFSMFWYVFIKASEAVPLGICLLLTRRPTLLGHPWSNMDPLFIGLPLSALVFILVSLGTPKPSPQIIEKIFTE